jgi:glycine/D-amino acid oxidase-like deaminating enzyme
MKNTRPHNRETSWTKDSTKDSYPTLGESFETDVCVIGGGIAGILSAYLLMKRGFRVALVEKSTLGGGATGLTTAFLTASIDTDFADLIKSFGPEDARSIIDSHKKAIDLIDEIIREEGISCDFKRCSNYFYASSEKDFSIIDEECDAALELGFDATLHEDGSNLAFNNFGYVELKNQAKFHPLKFIYALAGIMQEKGVKIFENTEADEILERDFGYSVRANDHSVQTRWVVCATYEPYHEPLRLYFKKGMYKTYILEAHTEWKIPEGIYEDTDNPYHYLRVDKEGTGYRLIIGGEDHREDIPMDEETNFSALESYLESIIPKESFSIQRRWTGPILEPVDGLAFIGSAHGTEGILYAFAFSGNGMTYAGIAAMLIRDHIDKQANPYTELYRTDRLPRLRPTITKGKDYAEEMIRGAMKNALTRSKKRLKDVLPKNGKKKKEDTL